LSRCRFGRKEKRRVPVAQPDRASDFGSEGWGFESLQARHFCNFVAVMSPLF
jgi:hypothetical protein